MNALADASVHGERVVEIFDAPRHAAIPAGANVAGEAESKSRASRVRFHLRVHDGVVEAAGFRVLGCPHAIAAAELVCADIEGRRLDALTGYDARFVEAALPLPAGKLDIRILVEDAVRSAAAGAD